MSLKCHWPIYEVPIYASVSSTSFFSEEYAFKTNICLYFPFPGFTLLGNEQKWNFYVILWAHGLLKGPCGALCGSQPKFCTRPSNFTLKLRRKPNITQNHHLWALFCYIPGKNGLFACFYVNLAVFLWLRGGRGCRIPGWFNNIWNNNFSLDLISFFQKHSDGQIFF